MPGSTGHARGGCEPARGGLVAEQFEQRRSRSYKGDAGGLAGARKGGILGEKAVTWVDGVDASFLGERDDAGDVQVGLDRTFAGADLIGLVGLEAVQAETVFLRVDADRAQTEFGGGAKDADGDFAAVGGEQVFESDWFPSFRQRSKSDAGTRHCFTSARERSSSLFDSVEKQNSCGLGLAWRWR